MKKLLMILFLGLLALSVGAQQIELTFLTEGDAYYKDWPDGLKYADGFSTQWQKVIYNYQKDNPGVLVRVMQSDLSSGDSRTLDTLLASGQAPDVITRTGQLVAKLMVDSYAIQPDKYIDVSDFTKEGLASATKNGKLFALPNAISVSSMGINLDMLAEVGYTLPTPDKWTLDEYLKLGRALKAKGHYLTSLFAKNQSSDHWWMSWLFTYGAKLYTNGDYSKTVINSPAAVKALNFMKQMITEQLVPPNPGEIDDDMALDYWCKGQVATLDMQIGHTAIMQSYAKQGVIPKEFKFTFVEFPHAVGAPRTPVVAGPTLVVGHKSNDEKRNLLVAKLMYVAASGDAQYISGISGNFPTSKKTLAMITNPNPYWVTVQNIISQVGLWDRGGTIPQFGEIRAQGFPLMQAFYTGQIDAQTVLNRYEKAVNAILSQ
jgi:ABC-type glycerol-3-phosphate transport system substrate-binding protein